MSALQIPRPTGLRAAPYTATFSVRPTSAHRLVLARSEKFEKFEREEKYVVASIQGRVARL